MTTHTPTKIAIIGAGPAGIYAADLLLKSGRDVRIDIIEKMPAPFGLIRYGVAPDHPRIKGIIGALHRVLDKDGVRLIGNVTVGVDTTIEELKEHYHAIIVATGALHDRPLNIPGADLPESYGAAEFVGFYDGNPDFARTWDLSASSVAVIGVGNVGLDVARILAKTADELRVTEIPDNVYETLKTNRAQDIHVFGRRGPAHVKFTPQELKELDHSPTVTVVVSPDDIDYDEAGMQARRESKAQDLVCSILEGYALRDRQDAPHRLHIHLCEQPVEILARDGHVAGLVTERTTLSGEGTGKFTTWEVGAVYRAVGYRSTALPGLPFDEVRHVLPNDGGHVLDGPGGTPLPGIYATGWIKRGPIGLIGNTKSDAKETIDMLLADDLPTPLHVADGSFAKALAERGVRTTSWQDWYRIDLAERELGSLEGRERKKLVEYEEMLAAAH